MMISLPIHKQARCSGRGTEKVKTVSSAEFAPSKSRIEVQAAIPGFLRLISQAAQSKASELIETRLYELQCSTIISKSFP